MKSIQCARQVTVRHCHRELIKLDEDFPNTGCEAPKKHGPRATAISKFGLDNLVPCSNFRLYLVGPFPSRAASFFRPAMLCLYKCILPFCFHFQFCFCF